MVIKMIQEIKNINSLENLKNLYDSVFGKTGTMTQRLKGMRDLDNDARAALNAENTELRAAFKLREQELQDEKIITEMKAGTLDAAAPFESDTDFGTGKIHPTTFALAEISAIMTGMGYTMESGPDVEDEWHNFTALNLPEHHPARDMQATFWLAGGNLLRPHTSPVQVRAMKKSGAPIKIFIPGSTYRYDMDATHIPKFHQFEGLVIGKDITISDLVNDWKTFLAEFFGREFNIRIRPSYFPFTEPSIEVDVEWQPGKWLEMGGGGMVHPNVLRASGVDPDEYQGFAFGLGVERLAMMKFGLNDLRKFYDGDVRWLRANGF